MVRLRGELYFSSARLSVSGDEPKKRASGEMMDERKTAVREK